MTSAKASRSAPSARRGPLERLSSRSPAPRVVDPARLRDVTAWFRSAGVARDLRAGVVGELHTLLFEPERIEADLYGAWENLHARHGLPRRSPTPDAEAPAAVWGDVCALLRHAPDAPAQWSALWVYYKALQFRCLARAAAGLSRAAERGDLSGGRYVLALADAAVELLEGFPFFVSAVFALVGGRETVWDADFRAYLSEQLDANPGLRRCLAEEHGAGREVDGLMTEIAGDIHLDRHGLLRVAAGCGPPALFSGFPRRHLNRIRRRYRRPDGEIRFADMTEDAEEAWAAGAARGGGDPERLAVISLLVEELGRHVGARDIRTLILDAEGWNNREIAEREGVTESAIDSRLRRARKVLRPVVTGELPPLVPMHARSPNPPARRK